MRFMGRHSLDSGDFVPDNKTKISYAPSFATESILKPHEIFIKNKIARINHISVRETSGLKILENIGIENAVQVMDPVFLFLNFCRKL